jgi:hypothetical protein
MNFDGKSLRVVVLGDGSAFGATGRTLTAGAREERNMVIDQLTESSTSVPFAGICIADCAFGA